MELGYRFILETSWLHVKEALDFGRTQRISSPVALERWLWRVTPFSWPFLGAYLTWVKLLPLRLSPHSWKQLLPSPHGNYGTGCHSRRACLYQTFPNLAGSVWRALGVIGRLFQAQRKVPGNNTICPRLYRSSFKDVPQFSDAWIPAEHFRMSVTSTNVLIISRRNPGCRGIYCLFSLASSLSWAHFMDNHFISLYEVCMYEEGQSELVIKYSYITVCDRSRLDVDITHKLY